VSSTGAATALATIGTEASIGSSITAAGSASSSITTAALSPTSTVEPPATRRPMIAGMRRGSRAAKPVARIALNRSDAAAANAPQPECWPSFTTGHRWAICSVAAIPAIGLPQPWPASWASPATARIEAIPHTSPVGPGMASAVAAAASPVTA
jgi:hypothetical protein